MVERKPVRTAIVISLTRRELQLIKGLDPLYGETVPERIQQVVREWLLYRLEECVEE